MPTRSLLRLGRLAALLCLLGVAAPLRASAAAGTPAVDQEQLTFNGALTVRSGTSQTFTVGRDGSLTRFDVPLCSTAAGNRIVFKVQRADGLPPDSGKIRLTFTTNSYKCIWFTFTLPTPLPVTAGEVLELLVTREKGFAPLWGADRLPGDPYPRGVGRWMGHTINDFAFRTWVASA